MFLKSYGPLLEKARSEIFNSESRGMNITGGDTTVTGWGSVAVTGNMSINGKLTVTGQTGDKATQILGTDRAMGDELKAWVADHTVTFGSNADVKMTENASITFETVNINGSKIDLSNNATISAWGNAVANPNADDVESLGTLPSDYTNADMTITGATVTLSGSTTLDANDGMTISDTDITVNGGTGNKIIARQMGNAQGMSLSGNDVVVKSGAKLTFTSDSIALANGTLTNENTGTVVFDGDTEITGTTVKNNGTANFSGDLTTTSDVFSGFFAKNSGGTVEGAITLDTNVDVVLTDNGAFDLGAVTSKITANGTNSLTFANGTLDLGTSYALDDLKLSSATLEVGDTSHEFTLGSGTSVTVSEAIDFETAAEANSTNTFKIGNGSTVATLTLNGVSGDLDNATYQVGDTSASGALVVADGDWSNAAELKVLGNGSVKVQEDASLTVGKLTSAIGVAEGKGITVDGGHLTASDIALTAENVVSVENAGTLTLDAADVFTFEGDATTATAGTVSTVSGKFTASGAAVDAVSYLELKGAAAQLGNKTTISQENFKQIYSELGLTSGILQLEGVNLVVSDDDLNQDGTMDLNKATGYAGSDALADITVNVSDSTAVTGSNVWAGVELTGTASAVTVGSSAGKSGLTLTGNDTGNFVNTANDTAGNMNVSGSTIINLQGTGNIGNITGETGGSQEVIIGGAGANNTIGAVSGLEEFTVTGATATAADVNVTEFNVDTQFTSVVATAATATTEAVLHNVTASSLNVEAGASLTTNKLTLGAASTAGATSDIQGNVTAQDIVINEFAGNDVTVSNGAQITAETFFAQSGSTVYVGSDTEENNSTGYLEVGTLALEAGSNFIMDPDYDKAAGLAVASDITTADPTSAGNPEATLAGNLVIGKNSAFGFGFDTVAELRAEIGDYLNGHGGLNEDNIGALVFLSKNLSLTSAANGQGNLYISSSADKAALEALLTSGSGELAQTSGSVTLGANTALIIGEDVNIAANGSTAAISGVAGAAKADATSQVILKGDYTAKDDGLKILAGNNFDATGFNAQIVAGNGLLEGTVNGKTASSTGVTVDLELAKDFDARLNNASTPVKGVMKSVFEGEGDAAQAGVDYILNVGGHDGGKSVEATSRLGVYGGAVQAAMLASQTSTDAVADRLGMASVNSALVYADNAQGGGLWLMPVYRSMDSEDFGAQGVNYGTDIDLYGVALGADFTTDSGVRVGGYFNVGSGDADGQQVASEVSNDFDYYGVGIYAGMNFGNFGLIADMGFTQVSNDLEQNAYYAGKLTADADSSAVTAGLRGEYKLELAAVDVVPHVGVRYTRLDMDSYDVTGADGVYASTSSDSMSVFSIPFGVSVSTDIEAGSWSVKPVFDVTLTANTGDDELDSDTTFTGAGMTSALSTEVLDSFTYGGTVGVQAKYGESLSLGVGLNYTGSDNTDAFGVTGDIRYMF